MPPSGPIQGGWARAGRGITWGIETDVSFASRKTQTASYATVTPLTAIASAASARIHRTLDASWGGSLRARAGRTVASSLVYLTAGLAFVHGSVGTTDSSAVFPSAEVLFQVPGQTYDQLSGSATQSHLMTGFTIGIGIERHLSPRSSLAAEYRYSRVGAKFSPNGIAADTLSLPTGNVLVSPPTGLHLGSAAFTLRFNYLLRRP